MCVEHRLWMDVQQFASSRGKDWTYIIFGKIGPTGKTYLRDRMRENGYNVIEITEELIPFVECVDSKNHYIVYEQNKCVVIVLNKPLIRKENRYESKGYLGI